MFFPLYESIASPLIVSPGYVGEGWFLKLNRYINITSHGAIQFDIGDSPYGPMLLPTYHALTPGYDATVLKPSSPDDYYFTIWPIIITNEDGSIPLKGSLTAIDDVIQIAGQWDGEINANIIVGNDIDLSGVGHVKTLNIESASAPTEVSAYFVRMEAGSAYNLLGSSTFKYSVTDLFDSRSNTANVVIEWFNGQGDRNHLIGSESGDAIDFNASSNAVGIHGLGGNDTIRGSQAGDNLNGDEGADRIGGKGGNDIINGGNGNDTIFGDAGNDTIDGGADNDTLWGGDGNDIIRGGLGNDQVYGEAGDDQVGGKAGNDAVHGGAGNDTIWGDEGNDALYGDAGNDNLNGGAGNDFLTGGLGIDRMRGEAGVDTFVFMRGEAQGDTILDFEGAGIVGGDKIEFRGYGAGATVHQVSGDTWQIDAAGITETFKIAGVTSLSKVDFYFT